MAKDNQFNDLEDFADNLITFTEKELSQLAENVFQTIIEKTPIDTGLLRTNWNMTRDTQGGVLTITIQNLTPYAFFVEEGTLTRDGVFMVESTLEQSASDFI